MPELPQNHIGHRRGQQATVAFLFTDVEGSTALWETDAAAARVAVQRQEALIRRAVEGHGGAVFKVVGDGVCAAFGTTGDAVRAALAAQLALGDGESRASRVRVRMAVHVGAAERLEDDYLGPAVNRAARVLGAAHGGQVLLSQAAAELVRERLPDEAGLLDLGEHELRGLAGPQQLFQLLHPRLPSRFPALRAPGATRHNLPAPPGPLVGRDAELRTITELLRRTDARLVTLTGTGGAGKTTLAMAAATELIPDFLDGVFLVELAALRDPALVVPAVAHELGLGDRGDRDAAEELRDHLRSRATLLVLDNFEQVLEAAPEVARLLGECHRIKVLATSRAPLRLSFERELPVEPLASVDPDRLPPLEELARVPAVALFVQRALEARPSFALTPENARDVAAVCARLEGLPLAIELAAARTRLLPPRELAERLRHGLDLLRDGPRDRPARHQTLRQAIDWSYQLLEPEAQRLLNRLSVFAGGFTPEAAEAVCASPADAGFEVLDGLATLLEMSLLRRPGGDDDRLSLLETIREHAQARLQASGEDARPAHARWFVELAERAERAMRGPEQTTWVRRLDDDHENVRAALRWSRDAGEVATTLRIAAAMWRYWELRGYLAEGRVWLESALSAAESADVAPALRVRSLCGAASIAKRQGDLVRAQPLLGEAEALARGAEDRWGLAATLNLQGMVAYERLAVAEAVARYEESLTIFRELGDRRAEAYVHGNLGLALAARDPVRAVPALREALVLFRGIGDTRGLAGILNNLGDALERAGSHEEARSAYEESLALKRELGARHGISDGLTNLASLALEAGEAERAESLYREALTLQSEMGAPRGAVASLRGLAALALGRGDFARAARFLGHAEKLSRESGVVMPGSERLARTEAATRAALGETALREELARGGRVSLADLFNLS